MAHIGRVGSVLMTLSVTVERFFAIVYPLKRIDLRNILIGGSAAVSIVYNVPRFFEFNIDYQNTSLVVDNETTYKTVSNCLTKHLISCISDVICQSRKLTAAFFALIFLFLFEGH